MGEPKFITRTLNIVDIDDLFWGVDREVVNQVCGHIYGKFVGPGDYLPAMVLITVDDFWTAFGEVDLEDYEVESHVEDLMESFSIADSLYINVQL